MSATSTYTETADASTSSNPSTSTSAPNSNPYNLPQPPPETLALLESLNIPRPKPIYHMGTITTAEQRLQLRDEHPMTRTQQADDGRWLLVEMGTNNYWDVGEPFASDMTRRHKAMQERLANLSDEDRRRLEEQMQPGNVGRMLSEAREGGGQPPAA